MRALVDAVAAERDLFRVLMREAPALGKLESVRRARAAFFEAGRFRSRGSGAVRKRAKLPHPEVDTWLINRMLANAVLEIAFLDKESEGAARRELLIRELVRLLHRMVYASD